jgi:hypothetical protein
MTWPIRLRESLASGKLVPFVGAGVSMHASSLPSWSELLEQLLSEGVGRRFIDQNEEQRLRQLKQSQRLDELATELVRALPKSLFVGTLERLFDRDAQTADLTAHGAIVSLGPSMVLTTNYDRLLEHAIARIIGRSPAVFTHLSADNFLRRLNGPLSQKRPLVLKLHGDITDPSSIVISRNDYSRILHDNKALHAAMSVVLATRTLLFLGYSLRDRDLLHWLEAQAALVKQSGSPHYMLVDPEKDTASNARDLLDTYGVEVVEFPWRRSASGLKDALASLSNT